MSKFGIEKLSTDQRIAYCRALASAILEKQAAKAKVTGLFGKVKNTAKGVYEGAKSKAKGAYEGAKGAAKKVGDKAKEVGGKVKEKTDKAGKWIGENKKKALGGALAAGAGVGAGATAMSGGEKEAAVKSMVQNLLAKQANLGANLAQAGRGIANAGKAAGNAIGTFAKQNPLATAGIAGAAGAGAGALGANVLNAKTAAVVEMSPEQKAMQESMYSSARSEPYRHQQEGAANKLVPRMLKRLRQMKSAVGGNIAKNPLMWAAGTGALGAGLGSGLTSALGGGSSPEQFQG